jgi:hypothetical protein
MDVQTQKMKQEVQAKIDSFEVKHASLLQKSGVQTQRELDKEIYNLIPEMPASVAEELGYDR